MEHGEMEGSVLTYQGFRFKFVDVLLQHGMHFLHELSCLHGRGQVEDVVKNIGEFLFFV